MPYIHLCVSIVFGVTSVRAPVNLHVIEADRVPTVIQGGWGGGGGANDVGSCLGRFVFSPVRGFVESRVRRALFFFEFGSRMSDKSAPQTPSRAAGSREDPILGVKVKDFFMC